MDIVECLCRLGFCKLEAQIYVTLLENGRLSGYQIAKNINISRSSVYSALSHMYEKGIVLLLSDDVQVYEAQKPSVLFERLKNEYADNAVAAQENLQYLYENRREERFSNIKGFETVVGTARDLLRTAQKEVYINTDMDLRLFAEDFRVLRQKGVRIIVFSFADLDREGLDIEFFTHHDPGCGSQMPSRIMLVADSDTALVADCAPHRNNWFGTLTNNPLMVSIAAEHIHNDIYLLRLQEKFGRGIIDDGILLHTIHEATAEEICNG